jgi:uncharacterized damage-inducible protein DinB
MKIDEIKLLYEYNYWANGRILTTCGRISPEQYVAPTSVGSYGSLRTTLVHTLDAEFAWLGSFQNYFVALDSSKGNAQAEDAKMWDLPELTEADVPTLDALTERWQAEEQAMRAYLGNLTDQDLNGLVRYKIPEGFVRERVLWHCLIHVVNHGTQHRSEAAALLTSYGQSPGDLDFTRFLNEHFHLPT